MATERRRRILLQHVSSFIFVWCCEFFSYCFCCSKLQTEFICM